MGKPPDCRFDPDFSGPSGGGPLPTRDQYLKANPTSLICTGPGMDVRWAGVFLAKMPKSNVPGDCEGCLAAIETRLGSLMKRYIDFREAPYGGSLPGGTTMEGHIDKWNAEQRELRKAVQYAKDNDCLTDRRMADAVQKADFVRALSPPSADPRWPTKTQAVRTEAGSLHLPSISVTVDPKTETYVIAGTLAVIIIGTMIILAPVGV